MLKKASAIGHEPQYQLDDDGTFVIENYNDARPFASFFPGIAGLHGIPLWAFYVNRNQGIASFGVKNKNYSITEFYPANTAYGLTATAGFRTFIKGTAEGKPFFYEPFATMIPGQKEGIRQTMRIRPWELELEDDNSALGLKTTVKYFTLPGEPIAALVRTVTVKNTGSLPLTFQVIDGHPRVLPYWLSGDILKHMSYTAQAWAEVRNLDDNGIPFYKLKVEINDRPEVTVLKKGNFYFGYVQNGKSMRKTSVIVDPDLVFGSDVSFVRPLVFMSDVHFSLPRHQSGDNKFPCAMSFFAATLAPDKNVTLNSMIGHISDEASLNRFARKAAQSDYFTAKARENRNMIEQLTGAIGTWSGKNTFDQYCRQTYLDNLLRGGMPILLPAGKENKVYYVYSRKHGDLERDYNNFQLSDSYYSQGNGNYRDMNQNKRNDIFFNPRISDHNVVAFYNLLQMDGGNPLIVKGTLFFFELSGKKAGQVLGTLAEKDDIAKLEEFLVHPFEPGGLLLFVENKGIRLLVKSVAFMSVVLEHSRSVQDAEHGEGYWTDHWTYNLDLLESYLAVYPEKEREILFERNMFTFFDNDHIVLPRSEKHVLAGSNKVRQFGSVVRNEEKAQLIGSRKHDKHLVHDNFGKGKVYTTSLIGKMVCLLTVKLATLDPDGIGVEMEADKPSWYDALNGLPGVFGSSLPETFELKRMAQFLLDRCGEDLSIAVPEELARFFTRLETALGKHRSLSPYAFWDAASTAKEEYRAAILFGVSGREIVVNGSRLRRFLSLALEKINAGLARATDRSTGLYYTYFTYEAKKFKEQKRLSHKGLPCVKIEAFTRHPLPFFLEGEVHYMKTEPKKEKVRKLFTAVRNSALYDRALGMYKVNASLAREPKDLGRCTVFTPGWLENESIWLHMEYKYLLELLKAGLYNEFFSDFARAGICFQDPARYGRSILENSSFISSSAFPDPAYHGRGFVARLSGSTAELIHMWLIMTAGHRPFVMNDKGELELRLSPVIPADYFTREGTFSFVFLGKTRVTYYNQPRADTFASGQAIQRLTITWDNGATTDIEGPIVTRTFAERIRGQEARTIEAYY